MRPHVHSIARDEADAWARGDISCGDRRFARPVWRPAGRALGAALALLCLFAVAMLTVAVALNLIGV